MHWIIGPHITNWTNTDCERTFKVQKIRCCDTTRCTVTEMRCDFENDRRLHENRFSNSRCFFSCWANDDESLGGRSHICLFSRCEKKEKWKKKNKTPLRFSAGKALVTRRLFISNLAEQQRRKKASGNVNKQNRKTENDAIELQFKSTCEWKFFHPNEKKNMAWTPKSRLHCFWIDGNVYTALSPFNIWCTKHWLIIMMKILCIGSTENEINLVCRTKLNTTKINQTLMSRQTLARIELLLRVYVVSVFLLFSLSLFFLSSASSSCNA